MKSIDLNCDLGELHPITGENNDPMIMPFISSCNICCGFHSSNASIIEITIRNALKYGLKIGAHPSYNDKEHFGRMSVVQDHRITLADMRYQIASLKGMCESMGGKLSHVKAHGALYHDIHHDLELAQKLIQLIKSFDSDLKLMGMANSQLAELCKVLDIGFIHECFADRTYKNKVQLLDRKETNSVIQKEELLLAQLDNILNGYITDQEGNEHPIQADTICLHSDTKGAVSLAKRINEYLNTLNVRIA